MRLLHVTNSLDLGGTAKTMQLFLQELQRRGVSVMAACRVSGPRQGLLEDSGISVTVLGDDVSRLVDLGSGIDILHLHISGLEDSFYEEALSRIRQANPKIRVYATNVFGGVGAHLWSYIDVQLCVSETLAVKVLTQHPDLENRHTIAILPNPIDTESITRLLPTAPQIAAYKKRLEIPSGAIVLSRVGRPDMAKWDPLLEKVFARVVSHTPNVVWLLQSAPEQVVTRLTKAGLASYCRFLAPTHNESEIVALYAATDILVHSSKIGETFGCTLAEAGFVGCPAVVRSTPFTSRIVYRDNAQIEVVSQGVTGSAVADSVSMAQEIERLVADASTRSTLGRNAHAKVESWYSLRHLTDSLLKMYANPQEFTITSGKKEELCKSYEARLRKVISNPKVVFLDSGYMLYRKIVDHF